MPLPSSRTILRLLAFVFGVLSLGDRGVHRLTGIEHDASQAGSDSDHDSGVSASSADDECPLCRLAAELITDIGLPAASSVDRTTAPADDAAVASGPPPSSPAAAAPRAPPASA